MVTQVPPDEMHTMYKLIWGHVLDLVVARDLKPSRFAVFGVLRLDMFDARCAVLANHFTPSEFSRLLGESKDVNKWKCTQMRQFGLYCSDAVMEGLVSERCLVMVRYLRVFNMLLVGMRGCAPSTHDLDFAQKIIEYVVTEYMKLKHEQCKSDEIPSIPYCMHLALHIVRYVRELKVSYSQISAFAYENFIRDLLPPVRSTNRMLEQIVNRHKRRELYVFNRDSSGNVLLGPDGKPSVGWGGWKGNYHVKDKSAPRFIIESKKGCVGFKFGKYFVGTNFADSWVLIGLNGTDTDPFSDPLIFRCVELVTPDNCHSSDSEPAHPGSHSGIFMQGYFYPEKQDRFTEPFPSSLKLEYLFSNKPSHALAQVPVELVVAKLYVYPSFCNLQESRMKSLTIADLGKNFGEVSQWVGISLRH